MGTFNWCMGFTIQCHGESRGAFGLKQSCGCCSLQAEAADYVQPLTSGKTAVSTDSMTYESFVPAWYSGTPTERYTVQCVAIGTGCGALYVGTRITGLPPGAAATSGVITGLIPNTQYDCYVIAVNLANNDPGVCSTPLSIKTQALPWVHATNCCNDKWEFLLCPVYQYGVIRCILPTLAVVVVKKAVFLHAHNIPDFKCTTLLQAAATTNLPTTATTNATTTATTTATTNATTTATTTATTNATTSSTTSSTSNTCVSLFMARHGDYLQGCYWTQTAGWWVWCIVAAIILIITMNIENNDSYRSRVPHQACLQKGCMCHEKSNMLPPFIICDKYGFLMQQHGYALHSIVLHFIRGIHLGIYNSMYACLTSHGTYSLTTWALEAHMV